MGGWTSTWWGHVLYEMMVFAIVFTAGHGITTIQPAADPIVKLGNAVSRGFWGQTVHDGVYETWTNREILGIHEKFGG